MYKKALIVIVAFSLLVGGYAMGKNYKVKDGYEEKHDTLKSIEVSKTIPESVSVKTVSITELIQKAEHERADREANLAQENDAISNLNELITGASLGLDLIDLTECTDGTIPDVAEEPIAVIKD